MASRRVVFWTGFLAAAAFAAAWVGAHTPTPGLETDRSTVSVPPPRHPGAPPLRILFIGNSLIYAADLPAMVQGLARTAGRDLLYEQHTPGGRRLADHVEDPGASALLARGGWDAVVLQEQSQWPALPDERVRSEVEPAALALAARAREADPAVRILLYETPAHRDGDPQLGAGAATYQGMQERIDRTYRRLASLVDGTVVPAGEAWLLARREHPEIQLYGDAVHPGRAGAYLTACVFYAVLFDHSPDGSPYTAGLPQPLAATLQGIAWRAATSQDRSRDAAPSRP
jgi:hypothetical protein